MRAIQNGDGHVGLTARAYPIDKTAAIRRGQVVKLSGGRVVSAAAEETAPILGIAAESHSGEADVLNGRSNGGEIMVYDNPTLIFECPGPVFAASGGSAAAVTAAAADVSCATADAFRGGRLKLKKKAPLSGNGDRAGTVREVESFASSGGTATFTVASGGVAGSGDEYYLFPPLGAAGVMGLDGGTRAKMVLSAAGCTMIKVVGWDLERNMLHLMAVEHSLGVEN